MGENEHLLFSPMKNGTAKISKTASTKEAKLTKTPLLSISTRLMTLSFPASNVEMMTKNRMSILLKTSWPQANQMPLNIRLSASHDLIPKPQKQSEKSFQ